MTTTGYGDIVPITIVGRIIGAIAMITGLIFTGYATASIASALIKKFREERDRDREMAQVLVETLRKERKEDKEDIKNLLNDIIEKMDKDKK
jgi:voltage-gated potassium channel